MSAKIVLFDIETAPLKGWAWQTYDTSIIKVIQPMYMLSYAWKYLGEDAIHVNALCDYPDYKQDLTNDYRLLVDLWSVFNDADILIAHNGDKYDVRFSNARFLRHGMDLPSPYKTVDTLKIAKRYFRLESNKLEYLATILDIGHKVPHTGFSLWEKCMAGDMDAWPLMREYNVHDVKLLEEVYLKLRPWATTHPNVNLYAEGVVSKTKTPCTTCGSEHTQRRGQATAKTRKYQRYHCKDCGHWFTGDLIKEK